VRKLLDCEYERTHKSKRDDDLVCLTNATASAYRADAELDRRARAAGQLDGGDGWLHRRGGGRVLGTSGGDASEGSDNDGYKANADHVC
jgi:hypothetical protein